MDGTWDDLNRRLTGAILALDLDDALLVGEERVGRKRGLFGFRPTPGPRRWVRITAARDVLIGEVVGSSSFGGEWDMSEDTEALLERQGWERPWSAEYRTFSRQTHLAGAPRLALAAVRALQALGCEMADLDVELVREDPTR